MAVKTREPRQQTRSKNKRQPDKTSRQRALFIQYLPAWIILLGIAFIILPTLVRGLLRMAIDNVGLLPGAAASVVVFTAETGKDVLSYGANAGIDAVEAVGDGVGSLASSLFGDESQGKGEGIAPLFTPEVAYWSDDIVRWSETYNLDPNLIATVMQIESCGHPTINSSAGAQGLFQVMPFHFGSGENMHDPDTNAMRSAGVLNECLRLSKGDAGLAMACYNGGPSVLTRPFNQWLNEPQRYFTWGTGIYADASKQSENSATLTQWLNAGGASLCDLAAGQLGID